MTIGGWSAVLWWVCPMGSPSNEWLGLLVCRVLG